MSKKWPGGIITPTPATPTGPYEDGAAPGIWTLSQQAYWQKQGLWPIAGNVALSTAIFFGGITGSVLTNISSVNISTLGNGVNFGSLLAGNSYMGACASTTRAVAGGGYDGSGNSNPIQYVTIASAGNATSFGTLTVARYGCSGCNSATRGLFGTGYDASERNLIDYITIATTGNATTFGYLSPARYYTGACSSPTRGVFTGGGDGAFSPNATTSQMSYVTIASTGNSTSFGNLTYEAYGTSACSSGTRGVIAGGTSLLTNAINYITIATTGNATTFGQLTASKYGTGAASTPTRGIFADGTTGTFVNTIDYITIATTGNAANFGQLNYAASWVAGTSNSNGGL